MGVAFAPDGRMFVWEKEGRVLIVKNGELLSTPFLDIRDHVNHHLDRGLVGLALDPNFASNGYVYLAYVFENQGNPVSDGARTQRITRVQADPANPDRALPGETVILGSVTDPNCDPASDCIPNNRSVHTIDHLRFGPDGKLYVGIGDGAHFGSVDGGPDPRRLRAQNLDSLNGKVLRLNPDGSGPADNPFFNGNPAANRSKIYAYGMRNPFVVSFDARDGTAYMSDVGSRHFEEVNRGRGANFGWPCYEGPNPNPDHASFDLCKNLPASEVTAPVFSFPRTATDACIIQGPVYNGAAYPSEMQGNLFYADFVGKWIERVRIEPGGSIGPRQTFASNLVSNSSDGPVYLEQGPDGRLYYVLIGTGQVRRINFAGAGSGNQPPTAVISATPQAGLSPLNVTFSSEGSSDPEGATLTYLWEFGDGNTSELAHPTYQYTAEGVRKFTARLIVKDPEGATGTASIEITVGDQPPTAAIEKPAPGTVASVGQRVEFAGSASDAEDGALPPSALRWEVVLQHNDHFHAVSDMTGSGGSFTVEAHGSEGESFAYLIRLTATDSSGLKDVREVFVGIAGAGLSIFPAEGASTSATISAGETASYALRISGPSGFQGRVELSCTDEPPGARCTITPASIELASGIAQDFTVAVSTTAGTVTAGSAVSAPWPGPLQVALAIFGGLLGIIWIWRKRLRVGRRAATASAALAVVLALAACAGVPGETQSPISGPTPPGSYNLRVTGSSGTMQGSIGLNLTVR